MNPSFYPEVATGPTPGFECVALDGVAPRPWRNGGGMTRELWAWPSANDWLVRVSVADITQDGPFSSFPGVDRWLTVLAGEGVVLAFAQEAWQLGPDDAPLRFDGATAPACRLQAGATRDLNLMTRQGAGQATLQRVQGRAPWESAAAVRAVFTAEPLQLHVDEAVVLHLPAGTLAVHTRAAGQTWWLSGPGPALRAWWLGFEPESAL